ncbi:hypothetical protein Tco_0095928, partial [Tanacetum coccineum]
KRVNTFVDYRTELLEESSKKAKIELEENLKKAEAEVMEDEEEVAIDVVPLATKPPTIVDWKIHKEAKKSYFQIIRADRSSKMYRVFSQMLKSFDMQDLEDLYKLGRIVGIISLLNDVSITVALIDVNDAQYKVTTARGSYYC